MADQARGIYRQFGGRGMTNNRSRPSCDQKGGWVSIADLLYDGKPYRYLHAIPPRRFERPHSINTIPHPINIIPHPINIPVHKIVTAIENGVIFTFDEFGRPIKATEGDKDDHLSKAFILNCLASYHKKINSNPNDARWHEIETNYLDPPDGVFHHFGWRLDSLPDFDKPAYSEAELTQLDHQKELAQKTINSYLHLIHVLADKVGYDLIKPYKDADDIRNYAAEKPGLKAPSRHFIGKVFKDIVDDL